MLFLVNLPCKPVVHQYIVNRYGTDSPLELPAADWLKVLVENLLQRNTGKNDKEINLQYYTSDVTIGINFDAYQRYGDKLSNTAARSINNCIENLIHEDLRLFLPHAVHACNYTLKDAITLWQGVRAFPEEVYSSDAIKKYYQRSIKPHKKVQKIFGINVPQKRATQKTLV